MGDSDQLLRISRSETGHLLRELEGLDKLADGSRDLTPAWFLTAVHVQLAENIYRALARAYGLKQGATT